MTLMHNVTVVLRETNDSIILSAPNYDYVARKSVPSSASDKERLAIKQACLDEFAVTAEESLAYAKKHGVAFNPTDNTNKQSIAAADGRWSSALREGETKHTLPVSKLTPAKPANYSGEISYDVYEPAFKQAAAVKKQAPEQPAGESYDISAGTSLLDSNWTKAVKRTPTEGAVLEK